jgi:hypothetical protein
MIEYKISETVNDQQKYFEDLVHNRLKFIRRPFREEQFGHLAFGVFRIAPKSQAYEGGNPDFSMISGLDESYSTIQQMF